MKPWHIKKNRKLGCLNDVELKSFKMIVHLELNRFGNGSTPRTFWDPLWLESIVITGNSYDD